MDNIYQEYDEKLSAGDQSGFDQESDRKLSVNESTK
jgi:hypothetical protein